MAEIDKETHLGFAQDIFLECAQQNASSVGTTSRLTASVVRQKVYARPGWCPTPLTIETLSYWRTTCADPRGIGNLSELLGACAGKSLGLLAQGF